MSRKIIYESPLASFMNDFVELKNAAGVNTQNIKCILSEFDNFYISEGIQDIVVTSSIITKWRKTRINDSDATIYGKFSVWNQLTRFMCRRGYECYIPPLPRFGNPSKNFIPYIFTHEQIGAIMKASEDLCLYDRHMDNSIISIPALFRLLYSIGLRISEALSIINEDVNLHENYIVIRKTKNGCERIAPISPSMKVVLEQYIIHRNKIPVEDLDAPKSHLFVKLNGQSCYIGSIYKWFRIILAKCNIPHLGKGKGPRVHDLRHTFAVHSLEYMVNNGIDLYASMPILSTCLGHKSLNATERYVRLTTEMYPHLAKQTLPLNMFIYPKLINDKDNED